jgi:hypothetical protein
MRTQRGGKVSREQSLAAIPDQEAVVNRLLDARRRFA